MPPKGPKKSTKSTSGEGAGKKNKDRCGVCLEPVLSGDKGLQCELCDIWFHNTCAEVSDELYSALVDSNKDNTNIVHWFCADCNTNFMATLKSVQALKKRHDILERKVDNLKAEVDDKFNSVELKLEQKANKDEVMSKEEAITEIKKETQTNIKAATDACASDILREVEEREKRKCNVVVFKVPELLNGTTEQKIAGDKETFQKICRSLGVEPTIKSIRRLGKKDPEVRGKHRPLWVQLSDPTHQMYLVSKAHTLKDSEDVSIKGYVLKKDMTPAERQEDSALWKELQDKRKEPSQSGDYKWVIRGNKVVQVKTTQQVN